MDHKKLRRVLLVSWMFTALGAFNLLAGIIILSFIMLRFGGAAAFMAIFVSASAFAVMAFIVSEMFVNLIFKGRRADPTKDAAFVTAARDVCRRARLWVYPRFYVMEGLKVPNAMAYGCGLPFLSAIAVTPKLVEMLTKEELEGVIAHEVAHIKCRDVGLMTLIGLILSLGDTMRKTLLRGGTALGQGPFAYVFAAVIWFITDVLLVAMRYAISQEREIAADALGSKYVGSSTPLMNALTKLHASRGKGGDARTKSDGPLSDLFISHPGLEERIQSLKGLMPEGVPPDPDPETDDPWRKAYQP